MEFFADLSSLDEIMFFIEQKAEEAGMGEKGIYKMQLACEEAIVNIISYAYPEKKGALFIDCQKRGHRFEISLRDHGVPFNPIDAEVNPQLDKPVNERKIGGLGIFLLRKTIDEASYQRINDENVLRLTFTI
jgi:anti-sigma regulatory factor (Ser/Thr protein kinase)